jgi:peptide alpha-N-acetyltransferase
VLSKGIPSAFANIKALYADSSKLKTIEELVENYTADSEIRKENDEEKQSNGNLKSKFEEARVYFLAQHYDYFRSRNLEKALENVEATLKLNPKSVEAYMTKARIWKHYGNTEKAAEIMGSGRDLEPSDRYINTKYAKYQLRNDDNEGSLKTMSKFTRNETVGGALGDLHDMQCMWYITEDGESNLRQEKLSVALKRFKAIFDIFEVWEEDQFDFHQFSIRKGQIRAYIEMMHWEDRLREHPFYARAAMSAIGIYIRLHDTPDLSHGTLANGSGDLASMNAVDKKKAIKKAKKEQERIAEEEAKKREAEKKATPGKKGTGADGEPKKEDPDPQGITLLETKTPLEDAVKFLQPLLEFAPKVIEHQNLGFEVHLRRSKNEPLILRSHHADNV